MSDDILQRLADAEEAKSGTSFRHGCIECGLSAVLCADAANEIENLRRERDEALALLKECEDHLRCAWDYHDEYEYKQGKKEVEDILARIGALISKMH